MVFFDGDKKMKKGMMKMNKINKIKICIIIGLFILVESICVFNMGDATSKHDVSVKELMQKNLQRVFASKKAQKEALDDYYNCEYERVENFVCADLELDVKSFYKTKISWEKCSVEKYIVFIASSDGKYKKVAELSGKQTSYVMKTKKEENYAVCIRGYKYNKKQKKTLVVFEGNDSFGSRVADVTTSEYAWEETYVSPKEIDLEWYCGKGIEPDGILIYRKDGKNKKYKCIGDVKWSKKDCIIYKDKKVKSKEEYVYKARNYKKINGKTYYGQYEGLGASAVNMYGKFTISEKREENTSVVKITSHQDNAQLCIKVKECIQDRCAYLSKEDSNFCYKCNGVSIDGNKWVTKNNWKKSKKKITIKNKESIWLRFEKVSSEGVEFCDYLSDEEMDYGHDICLEVVYRYVPSFLILNPYEKSSVTMEDGEAVH